MLANIGYIYEQQSQPIGELSFGQRTRLLLLALRLTEPTFYLLDEPTNHLDIHGREQLEREIVEREPSALVISHDRHFVRAIGTRFFEIDARLRLFEVDSPEPFFDRLREKDLDEMVG
jgi:ATPase subunit of ABC transporter with duplicated ATPase domains